MGPARIILRILTACAAIALMVMLVWLALVYQASPAAAPAPTAAATLPSPTETVPAPPFQLSPEGAADPGIARLAKLHTILPARPRFAITDYEVKAGDTLFGIADSFGLKPQTILFSNQDSMFDDPHRLQVGQHLRILPVNGALYTWHEKDGLNGVASYFKVTVDDIIDWPGNNLSRETLGELARPNIQPGAVLMIPNGVREFRSWSAPFMSRKDPAKSKIFGPGYCGTITDGYNGTRTYVWPSTERSVSGYDFSPETNHWGIDIAGQTGNPVFAADSGVIVYAGWNDWGYGYAIVMDHGNGVQTLYGHLSAISAGCGTSVTQGASIGAVGSTGRSTGPHLHFEIMLSDGTRVNPWLYLR